MKTIRRAKLRVNATTVERLIAKLKRKSVRLRAMASGTLEITNAKRLTRKDHATIDDNYAALVGYLRATQSPAIQDRAATREQQPVAAQATQARAAFNPDPKPRRLFGLELSPSLSSGLKLRAQVFGLAVKTAKTAKHL